MKCGHQQNELEAKIDGNQVMTLNILVTLKMKDDDEMIEFINVCKVMVRQILCIVVKECFIQLNHKNKHSQILEC